VIVDLCEYTAKTKALPGAPPLQSLPLKPPLPERGGKAAAKPVARRPAAASARRAKG
jgi:hypothetical protein